MKALFCTCNATVPLDEKNLRNTRANGTEVFIFDALCKNALEALPALDPGPDGVFIGCAREKDLFGKAIAKAGLSEENLIVWDLSEFIRDLPAHEAAHRALAYAEAARELFAKRQTTPTRIVSVGPMIVLSGPGTAEVSRSLSRLVDTLWIGDPAFAKGIKYICGKIIAARGSIGAFEIEVETGSPVDHSRCVDCGACVTACPHNAIGKDFRIDFDRCDSCRACENACEGIGAFSLDRKSIKIKTDQIIWSEGSAIPIPGIYLPQTSEALLRASMEALSTAIEGKVEATHSIVLDSAACVHFHAGKTGCTRCIDICPNNAIFPKGKSLSIGHELCSGCGQCVAACPTGAIDSLPWSYNAVGASLALFASAIGDKAPLALICSDCDDVQPVPAGHIPYPYPKLSTIDASHILGALAAGAPGLAILPCPDCAASSQSGYTVALEILSRMDAEGLITWGSGLMEPDISKPEALKKIDFLSWEKKRPALAAILKSLVDATSGMHPPLDGPFGGISVNSQRCSGCGACLDACHTDALKADEKRMALKTCEALCVACGLCEAVCPESAISVQAGLRWNSEVFRYRTAARVQGIACANCGKVFATRRAVETVVERLADRVNQRTRQLLMLCPDCRVVMALTEGKF